MAEHIVQSFFYRLVASLNFLRTKPHSIIPTE